MLVSWIKQFVRVSGKGKFYTIVNTLGLAIGLMCTIIILLWVDFQKSYDKFHPDYERIFQAYEVQTYANGYTMYTYSTPAPLSGFLKEKFSNIESSTRFFYNTGILGLGEKAFRDNNLGFTDSSFFSIFKVEFLSGSPKNSLNDINSIVLTESLAKKIFGSTDVVGKGVRINGNIELTVTAVIKDYPKNSNISFTCLISFNKLKDFGNFGLNQWGWNSYSTFVKLKSLDNLSALVSSIQTETNKAGVSQTTKINLHPIEKVRLYDPDPNSFSFITLVAILASVAGFVLILACINFINLITARAANRAKEVGIRKVIGSSKVQLIVQYFMESLFSTVISLLIAILLVDFALPIFNQTLGTELKMDFTNFIFWSKIFGVVLIVGLVSGIYPALVLSSFQPSKVLKGMLRSGAKGAGFRKTMVIVQYTITIFLMIVTFFMFRQLSYINNKDTGMSRKNIVSIPFRKEMVANYKSLKDELRKIPNVKYVTATEHIPFRIYSSTSDFSWSGKDTTQTYLFSNTKADEFLTDAMEIKMAEGRFFSSAFPSDSLCVVINETAAKIIDKKEIIGEVVDVWNSKLKVIGVMKDFNFEHFSGKIQPLFILYGKQSFNFILIKTHQAFDSKTLEQVKKVFADFYPEYPFESTLLEDSYQNMFSIEKQLRSILGQFTLLAILISCVGLLSLAAYIAEQQRKSLVLRKIHGASATKILAILLASFTKWVIISGVIAIPLSYITLNGMFSRYAFHTEYSWWIFAGALIFALLIAIITVFYQAIKTARVNPVEILRYE